MKTCLECGFLTIEGRELQRADRVMLGTLDARGQSAVMPMIPESARCFKNLWDYDLTYSGDSLEGVIDELGRDRSRCPGFVNYEAGFTPVQHLDRLDQQRDNKLQWRIAKIGFWSAVVGGIVGAIVTAILGLLIERHSK
jgi:hypothetical protein